MTCVDISVLLFKEDEREKHEIMVGEKSSSQSRMRLVQIGSARESAEKLTLFSNEVI